MESTMQNDQIVITEEMVTRAIEFFHGTNVSSVAAETSYPEFVYDLLNFAILNKKPWAEDLEEEPAIASDALAAH